MTYFLSGVYLLPEDEASSSTSRRSTHRAARTSASTTSRASRTPCGSCAAPGWRATRSARTSTVTSAAPTAASATGRSTEWKSEIAQAKSFVKTWKTNAGMKNGAPLPFDYDKELIGARTPCLEGQKNFMRAARELGFRYDTSGINDQVWPKKKEGLWDLSMQLVPVPGRAFEHAHHGLQLHGQPVGHRPRATRPSTRTGATRCVTACSRASTAPTTATARR